MKQQSLSFWDIWNMSFGFLGIQFGYALQGGFMSRIFQTLGASTDDIPLLWVAAPLTGLIVQPIIGYLSDRTWHSKLGRRRPYCTPNNAPFSSFMDSCRFTLDS
jgi:maltose/moltooligosaccharide transporter